MLEIALTSHFTLGIANLLHCTSNFAILHIYCRSMRYKLNEIRDILTHLRVVVLALTETWLETEIEESIKVPGYNSFTSLDLEMNEEGVGMFIRDSVRYKLQLKTDEYKSYASFL